MWATFLNILAIIGVIIVGAIIVYLIANLVLTGLNKNEPKSQGVVVTEKKEKSKTKDNTFRPTVLDTNELDDDFENDEVNNQSPMWNNEQAEAEKQQSQSASNNLVFDSKPVEPKKAEKDFDDFDDIFNEDNTEEQVVDEVDDKELESLIKKINVESVAEYNALKKTNETAKVEEKQVEEKLVEVEPVKEEIEETQIEQEAETKEEKAEVQEAQEDTVLIDGQTNLFDEIDKEEQVEEIDYEQEKAELEQERKEIAEEQAKIEAQKADLEEQRKQLEEELQRLQELKEEQSNVIVVSEMSSVYGNETLEQLEARLEMLNERLKANKKDLRENKKEYNPLAKVKKTLEKDKAKLTRKEAIVARQKVILYGVNNYVDIDEEKAKKLNEDLDLLDGLRLSVQHCEDVMNANKDRFPILEKTNKILKKVNAEIMSDIAEVEKAIAEKKGNVEE